MKRGPDQHETAHSNYFWSKELIDGRHEAKRIIFFPNQIGATF